MIKIAIVGTGGIAEWHANEFKKNQMQLQSMRNENRRLQNRKRHLESCSRYPGKYMNCPNIY